MRLLALIPPGTNSRCQFLELLRGAQQAGHDVLFEEITLFIVEYQRRVAAKDTGASEAATVFARYLEHTVRERRADAVMTLWLDPLTITPIVRTDPATPRESSFLELLGVPSFHWWLDAPFWAYSGRALPALVNGRFAAPTHTHIINNPGTADEMRRVLGLQRVAAHSYGVDAAMFRPWPVERDHEIALNAGPGDPAPTPFMLEQLKRDDPDVEAIRRDQAAKAETAVVESIRPLIPDAARLATAWVTEQLRDPDRPMLDKLDAACAASGLDCTSTVAAFTRATQAWAQATAALRTIESWQRAFTAAFLSQRFKALIVGPVDWAQTGWPIRGTRTGPLMYHELSLAFSRCKVGVNIMRYQDDIGLNPKLLEMAASGCVAAQRWRVGFDEFFREGEEAVSFRTPSGAVESVRALLTSPDRCRAVAQAGRERVLRDHQWSQKAARLFASG